MGVAVRMPVLAPIMLLAGLQERQLSRGQGDQQCYEAKVASEVVTAPRGLGTQLHGTETRVRQEEEETGGVGWGVGKDSSELCKWSWNIT